MEKLYKTEYLSPVGKIIMSSEGTALNGLWFECQKYFGGKNDMQKAETKDLKLFQDIKIWLDKYFQGEAIEIGNLPLKPLGNEFKQSVWKILCEIPYGETTTYGEIAEKVAKQKGLERMSAQAVGGAVGHNPISIIIPCHRVVGKNGKLTGYAGGLKIKQYLLQLEKKSV